MMSVNGETREGRAGLVDGGSLESMLAQMSNLSGQLMMFRAQTHQQLATVLSTVDEHAKTVTAQLAALQTGGAKRAMAAVFYKLFRDLLRHMDQLDGVVDSTGREEMDERDSQWVKSFSIARDGFERVLADYGCMPVPIEIGRESFDPEKHEAVGAEPGEVPEGAVSDIIVAVRRRGWTLDGRIIQFPQVVVA